MGALEMRVLQDETFVVVASELKAIVGYDWHDLTLGASLVVAVVFAVAITTLDWILRRELFIRLISTHQYLRTNHPAPMLTDIHSST
jgi:hypothetical protein